MKHLYLVAFTSLTMLVTSCDYFMYTPLTGKSELNAYGGRVRFFRVKDKFGYKIKMR